MSKINFTLEKANGSEALELNYERVFAIGYAGRNMEKTMEHIKELEEQLGVPAPKRIPTIFQCGNYTLTQEKDLHFVGEKTCGEVEYVIIIKDGKRYIGVGSDHTDRALESASVPKSKQACAKPIAVQVWDYEDMKDHWDGIKLRSYQTVDGKEIAYQDGTLADILPPDLITFSKDAAELLADLQSRNERMFLLTFTVVNMAPTRQRLENDVFTVGGIAQKYNCALKRLDWQQEQGFVSSLALGYNEVEIQRGMTTSSTAIFIPFMTRELRMDGQALYYGMNALSHNVIMADRKKLKSANGMYLGSTGSGKSFAAKRELLNVFLTIPQDRIIIVDPMGEYAPLVRRLGGQVIEIAPDSPHHLNPMDVELNMAAGESPLSMKADFLLSLCELVVGGKEGLQPIEKTVVDRCVRLVYREQALGLDTGKTPLLQDLYEELLKQPEPEARRVATALELYCTGSLNLFNHPTNVKTDSRVVCIVLKNMGENLRKIAMHITNEFVSQAVDTNFREGVATWCYFDEFHVLLRDPLTASYFVAVWKMLRKKGCVPSALTQNVKDLLASREIENILDNTDFMILLSQAQSDRAILARQLGISEHQLSYITHSNSGEGLLFYGNVTIPFVDRFPKGEIYDLLTTRPEDMKNEAKTE